MGLLDTQEPGLGFGCCFATSSYLQAGLGLLLVGHRRDFMVGCPLAAAAAVLSCRVQPGRWIAPHLAVRDSFLTVAGAPLWSASWLPAVDKSRGSKSVEVQSVWEVYDERLQFMSRQDALQLDESLDAGDVSRAWLVWSGAAETALSDACVSCLGLLLVWVSLRVGFSLGFLSLSLVRVVVAVLLSPGVPLLLTLRRFCLVLLILMSTFLLLMLSNLLIQLIGGVLERGLSSLGLPGWFRHAYFEYHAHVRLRFKLASGLGAPWTRDGGIPQGGPLSMMFIVALYLPWCRYLAAQEGVQP